MSLPGRAGAADFEPWLDAVLMKNVLAWELK